LGAKISNTTPGGASSSARISLTDLAEAAPEKSKLNGINIVNRR
jgi:hypothetical protein